MAYEKKNEVKVTLKMPKKLYQWLQKYADRNHLNLNYAIAVILLDVIKKEEIIKKEND